MIDDPLFRPGDQKVLAPDGDISPASRRCDIAWLVLLSIVVLVGIGALCFAWWWPGAILLIGGAVPAGAILRGILAERAMVRRMRERGTRKT